MISIIIATYKRSHLLTTRAIPSVLAQTQKRWELIVVGDCDPEWPNVQAYIDGLGDKRVRGYNLPERPAYPKDSRERWMVAGSVPQNFGIDQARGRWITFLDDDDEYYPHRLETMLKYRDKDFVYSAVDFQSRNGTWYKLYEDPPRIGCITRISFMYRASLKVYNDLECWKKNPADWDFIEQILNKGATVAAIPEPLAAHHSESWRGYEECDSGQWAEANLNVTKGEKKMDLTKVLWIADAKRPVTKGVELVYMNFNMMVFTPPELKEIFKKAFDNMAEGGVLRVATFDLDAFINAYKSNWKNQAWMKLELPEVKEVTNNCQMLNLAMRGWGAKFVYNEKELKMVMEEAGFSKVVRCKYGSSDHEYLKGSEMNKDHKLILEGIK